MWLEWTDGRISFIPDYRYYVVDDAELVLAPATRLRARGPPTDEPRSALGRRRPRSSQKKPNRKSQTEKAKRNRGGARAASRARGNDHKKVNAHQPSRRIDRAACGPDGPVAHRRRRRRSAHHQRRHHPKRAADSSGPSRQGIKTGDLASLKSERESMTQTIYMPMLLPSGAGQAYPIARPRRTAAAVDQIKKNSPNRNPRRPVQCSARIRRRARLRLARGETQTR